jgi:integrase
LVPKTFNGAYTNMALTDRKIIAAMAGPAISKLSDGGGLQLWITPDGAKRWRLAYRYNGKQKVLALGVYPTVTLRGARDARDKARRLLGAGQDPSLNKKLEKAARLKASANTFDAVADELLEKKRMEGKAQGTFDKVEWLLSLARSVLGERPVAEITAPEVLRVLKTVEARGRLETAKRLRATIGQVFRFAVATGRADIDPTASLRGAIASPVVQHRAAILEPKAFGGLLRAIASYEGAPETKAALDLLALTFVRPGEIRAAEWSELDLDGAIWSIPAAKMKMRRPHRIPLAPRALTLLRELHRITGSGRFVFPSNRSRERCMSENTINGALRRLGFTKDEMTAHGFRSAASSMLNECGIWNPDAIERQLAHVDNDSVRRAYARADYWDERVRIMDWWAERCGEMQAGGMVVPLRQYNGH